MFSPLETSILANAQLAHVSQATGAASWVWLCVAIPLVSAGVLLVLGKASDAWGHFLAIAASCASFVIAFAALIQFLGLPADQRVMEHVVYRWVPAGDFSIDLAMRIDPLSLTFLMLVTFVGTLIHIYSVGYMKHDVARRRFFAYLNFFVASMLLLVLGNSYLVLFVGWEGVGLASYLLISFWNHVPEYATAGKKAFIMNRVGDMGMLIAMMAMFAAFGTVSFTGVNEGIAGASATTVTVIGIFLLVAATGKSAQFPLQAWLGDAMAGPTPVSALIHAATMVTAGVYLMVRSGLVYQASPTAALLVTIVGAITLTFGAIVGAAKDDMKKVLAASTMSQIGYMMLAAGLGPVGAAFAIFHLVTHGFFKANMFLGAGSVMHAMKDEVNMRGFGGLRKYLPITWATFLCGYLAIIGFPFLSGFYSKDKIIEAAFVGEGIQPWIYGCLTVLVAGLTAFYMSRLFFMIFHGKERFQTSGDNAYHPHEAPASMYVPQVILALGSLGLGFAMNQFGFVSWLEPAIGHVEHGEPVLPVPVITCFTLVMMAVGVAVAYVLYVRREVPAVAPAGNALVKAARNDLYQDSFNEHVFMKPGMAVATGVDAVDNGIIDGIVEGIARLCAACGKLVTKFQNGYVRAYANYMLVGVVIAVLIAVIARW